MITNFRDGKKFTENDLFRTCPEALQINLYYDDVEVCNPLGSKRKIHKLGRFTCLLGEGGWTLLDHTGVVRASFIRFGEGHPPPPQKKIHFWHPFNFFLNEALCGIKIMKY